MDCLIDLDEGSTAPQAQCNNNTPGLEPSYAGDAAAAGHDPQAAKTEEQDPFAGFEALSALQQPAAPASTSTQQDHETGSAQQDTKQPNADSHSSGQQQSLAVQATRTACLKAAAERAARASDVLQQHSMEQGESNAKLRLLLATVAAKQVKARKMLADLSNEFNAALADSEHSGLQQLQELTARLQQAHQQVAAAQADAEQQRKAASQQAELAQLRENELQELRAELKALRKSESHHRREVQDLHERLLETEAALSRLSGALPGAGKVPASTLDSMSDDGSAATDSAAPSPSLAAADATDGHASPLHTPARPNRQSRATWAGAGVGGSMGGVNVMTPDQAAAAQLRSWLAASQAALIEAQDDVLAREAEIKQLQEQVKQLKQQQQLGLQDGQQQQQGLEQGAETQPQQQQLQSVEQLQELQAAVDAAEVAAAAAQADREQLGCELSSLREELSQLRSQLTAADIARSEAVAAMEALQQQQQQQGLEQAADGQQQEQAQQPATGNNAAAEAAAQKAAAAEAELQKALVAAAEAADEVEALQQQLQQLQQAQQQAPQPASPKAAATAAGGSVQGMFGPSTPEQQSATEGSGTSACLPGSKQASTGAAAGADGAAGAAEADAASGRQASPGLELLQANSRIHVLQGELQDTQESMRLLLKLVKKCAAAAAGAALKDSANATNMSAAAATALNGEEKQQLLQMLSGVSDADSPAQLPDAVSTAGDVPEGKSAAAAAAAAAADARVELGWLHGLLHKLECRYSTPKHLQEAMLRGREMEHLLCTALQQVHAIKAEARGGPCVCPSEADYLQASKPAAAVAGAGVSHEATAGQPVGNQLGAVDAAAMLPDGDAAQLDQQQQLQHAAHRLPQLDTLTAAEALQEGGGWLQPGDVPEGYGIASDMSTSGDGYSSYEASGGWDSWRSQSGGGAMFGGSCGGDALPALSSTNSGAGAAAGSSCGGGLGGGLAPLPDENMGYDGLEGAWWAKSSIDQPVTELPDFLMKKS